MGKNGKFNLLSPKPLSIIDWIIFAFLALLCYFSFQQADLLTTAPAGMAYLNGHILDFYDFTGGSNYMPSTYILFAIWDIPIKLLNITVSPILFPGLKIIMWYKLLPTIFYMASGYLVYKIAQTIGMGDHKAKLCGYAFLTMPIGFFSQFIFGQYDTFTVFFMLLGLLFFYKKKWVGFAIFFGISLTFKYFPLLIFIPLLLLVEKRILQILKYVIIALIPLVVEIIPYLSSPLFKAGVGGFGAVGYIFQVSFTTSCFTISVVAVAWLLLAGYAYFHQVTENDEIIKWSIYYSNLVTFLIFGLSMWHPQWLVLAVPFWVLGAFLTKKFDIFIVLELVLMLFFVLFTVNNWPNHVDQQLFNLGVFRSLLTGHPFYHTIRGIYPLRDISLIYSAFSGVLLVYTVFKHPKYMTEKISEPVDHFWGWVRLRVVAGISFFIVPAFVCFFIALSSPYLIYDTGESFDGGNIGTLIEGRTVSQIFVATSNDIDSVEVLTGTYARSNESDLTVDIVDVFTKQTIASTTVDMSNFEDNNYNEVSFDSVQTEVGHTYAMVFSSDGATEADCITIYHTPDNTATPGISYASVDSIDTTFNLCVRLFSDKAAD